MVLILAFDGLIVKTTNRPLSQKAGIITILSCNFKKVFLASFLSENSSIVTHIDEARKANLHAYKRIAVRPAIYKRGL